MHLVRLLAVRQDHRRLARRLLGPIHWGLVRLLSRDLRILLVVALQIPPAVDHQILVEQHGLSTAGTELDHSVD